MKNKVVIVFIILIFLCGAFYCMGFEEALDFDEAYFQRQVHYCEVHGRSRGCLSHSSRVVRDWSNTSCYCLVNGDRLHYSFVEEPERRIR